MIDELDDSLLEVPISALEHYSYCPRQCALIHVEQTFDENVYTIRGRLVHDRVDSGEETSADGVRTLRSIPVWSQRHGLRGLADAVEFRATGPYPVEYKSGRRHSRHAAIQLCAQALCLEEMLETTVERGAVFYHAARRREEVLFDDALRQATLRTAEQVRAMLLAQAVPSAPNDARCPDCSLIDSCMPAVVAERNRLRGLQGALFVPAVVGDA